MIYSVLSYFIFLIFKCKSLFLSLLKAGYFAQNGFSCTSARNTRKYRPFFQAVLSRNAGCKMRNFAPTEKEK